jgi:dehydrogenase/reductase SDR family protein 7B
MEVLSYVFRQMWTGRSLGKTLLMVGVALAAYQAYKRWRRRRALSRLSGKVVLITGASSGLGEALARLFHSVGAKVILASRNLQKLQALKFQLDTTPTLKESTTLRRHSPKTLVLDLSSPSSLPDRAREALRAFGRVDILVNNAGISSRGAVLDTELSVDRKIMETNFFGTVSLTRALLPAMVEQGGGHIVVVSSLQGKIGIPHRSSYAASKHALHGYFDSLRCELGPSGVRVSTVCPGYIRTQLSLNALAPDGSKHGVLDPTTAKGMSPEYVAEKILYTVAEGGRSLIVATPTHHLALYLSFFWPSLLDWVLQQRAKIT